MWRLISSLTIAVTPFRWRMPGLDKSVLDFVLRAGPFTIVVSNG